MTFYGLLNWTLIKFRPPFKMLGTVFNQNWRPQKYLFCFNNNFIETPILNLIFITTLKISSWKIKCMQNFEKITISNIPQSCIIHINSYKGKLTFQKIGHRIYSQSYRTWAISSFRVIGISAESKSSTNINLRYWKFI